MPVPLCIAFAVLTTLACGGRSTLTTQEQAAVTQMKRALEEARNAQERFYAREGYYTTDPELLDIADIPGQAALLLEQATIDAYVVSATHPSTDRVCVLVQPPNRPVYTRCDTYARGKDTQPLDAGERHLDLGRLPG